MTYGEKVAPIIDKICNGMRDLLKVKAAGYGPSWLKVEKMMLALYPNGIKPYQYRDSLIMVRVCDKFCRLSERKIGEQDPGGESPWKDVTGYGIVMQIAQELGDDE